MNRLAYMVFLLLAGCRCVRVEPIQSGAEIPGTYVLRRVNDVDFSNRLTLSSDGGYCHGFQFDGGATVQCGGWTFETSSGRNSSIALGEFQADELSDPPNGMKYGYSTERRGRARRIVIDADSALYFVAVDGGEVVTP
ncbi:MAG: hypothetical protein ACO1OB_19635 [Archangium sp.]